MTLDFPDVCLAYTLLCSIRIYKPRLFVSLTGGQSVRGLPWAVFFLSLSSKYFQTYATYPSVVSGEMSRNSPTIRFAGITDTARRNRRSRPFSRFTSAIRLCRRFRDFRVLMFSSYQWSFREKKKIDLKWFSICVMHSIIFVVKYALLCNREK